MIRAVPGALPLPAGTSGLPTTLIEPATGCGLADGLTPSGTVVTEVLAT